MCECSKCYTRFYIYQHNNLIGVTRSAAIWKAVFLLSSFWLGFVESHVVSESYSSHKHAIIVKTNHSLDTTCAFLNVRGLLAEFRHLQHKSKCLSCSLSISLYSITSEKPDAGGWIHRSVIRHWRRDENKVNLLTTKAWQSHSRRYAPRSMRPCQSPPLITLNHRYFKEPRMGLEIHGMGWEGGDSGLRCPGSARVICPGQFDLQDSPSHPPVYHTINSLYMLLMLQTGSQVSDFSAQVSIKPSKECYTFANKDGAVHEGGHTG